LLPQIRIVAYGRFSGSAYKSEQGAIPPGCKH
jgi:hypothetical protein